MTRHCPNCGAAADADQSFCTDCGSALAADASDESRGSDSPAAEPSIAPQHGERATSAFFGYAFITLARLSGATAVFRGPSPALGGALGDAAQFAFYDGFLLVLAAALASGYVAARWHLDLSGAPSLDRIALLALSAISLLYGLGIAGATLA